MAAILKIPILILGAWLIEAGIKPPTAAAKTDKGDKVSSTSQKSFEKYVRIWSMVARYGSSGLLIVEAVLVGLSHFGGERWLSSKLFPVLPPQSELSAWSPLFILGLTSIYLGGCLRLWCYRTLGAYFTFEISIRSGHKLVTRGPYGIVRHPSYLAVALIHTGAIIFGSRPDSYFNACGVFSAYPIVRWVFIVWALMLEWFVYSLVVARPAVEDRNLKAAFGKEWDDYHQRVPFKVFPLLY